MGLINNLAYTAEQLENKNGIYIEHEAVFEKTKPHKSCYYHLVYIAHEYGVFTCGDEHTEAAPGDVFLINPGVTYEFAAPTGKGYMSVYSCAFFEDKFPFALDRARAVFPAADGFLNGGVPYIRVKDSRHREIRTCIVRMIDDTRHYRQGFEFIIEPLLSLILTAVFRIYSRECSAVDVTETNHVANIVINYLQKHLHERISTEGLAERIHVSKGYLCRAFKKYTGMTISAYVNLLRVEKIKDELKNTDRPIRMVYDYFTLSHNYIARIFKESTGMTLNEYREKYHYKSGNSIYN